MAPTTTTIKGVVDSVTEDGLTLRGQRLFLDYTRQHKVEPPLVGQSVILTCSPKKDKSGEYRDDAFWINQVAEAEGANAPAPRTSRTYAENFEGDEAPAAPPASQASAPAGRWSQADTERMTRLSLLSTAATFLAGRQDATKRDLMRLAKYLEPYAMTGEIPDPTPKEG